MNAYDIEHQWMKNALVRIAQAELRARKGLVTGTSEMQLAAARDFAAEIRATCDDLRKKDVFGAGSITA